MVDAVEPEGTDPGARAREEAHQVVFAAGGGGRTERIAAALAAAGLLRDQPARVRARTEYRVWDGGSITRALGIDDAEWLVEGTGGRIEQRKVYEYREVGPWRPVEEGNTT